MSGDTFLKDDLIQLRKDLGLTQQEMAARLDMALRAYQAIEAGESEYRFIHRLAAERVALAIAVDKMAPSLAPATVRRDAIDLVREGQRARHPAYSWDAGTEASNMQVVPKVRDTAFSSAYAVVGEFVLIANALDYQLNHVLIQILHLTDSPMLEAVIATLDMGPKIEMLKERAKHIAQPNWQKPVTLYLGKLERISAWRNIACHVPLVPDDRHVAVFAAAKAAMLLGHLQLGEEPTAKRIPIAELKAAITLAESALGEGENLVTNFKKLNAERAKRVADAAAERSVSITVYRVPISKEQFEKLPADERSLVLLAGHILNQVCVFMKLVRFSTNSDPTDPIEARVSAAQSQIVLRCLMGVLAEAWEFVRRPTNQRIIGNYLDSIDDDGKASYDKLKKQFGKSALLHKLRNGFLYHYPDPGQFEKAFEAIPADEEWEWYFSEANTNSFYFSSELAVGYGIMSATKEPEPFAAFGIVMQEVMQAANTLPYFLMPIMKAILTKHLGGGILRPQEGTIIKNAPQLGGFWIPFFAETYPR